MPAVNREMLTIARESRRLTQDELAQRVGVVQGTVSKAESGSHASMAEDLVPEYAKHLRYPIEFFYQQPSSTRLPVTFYRKKKKVDAKHLRAIDAQMRILRMHLDKLLRSVDVPPLRVPLVDLRKYPGSAADLAQELRLRWHVAKGPVGNMTRIAESHGCFVIKWSFDTPDVDALSMHEDGLPPVIAVDPGMPGDRLRFTIAHELGHIAMHHHLALPGGDCETEADEFAAEFLMPRDEISPFLRSITLEKLAQLKAHWRTSMAALLKRAGDLNTITESQSARMWATMRKLGLMRAEPVPVAQEEPTLIRELVSFHMTKLGYSATEMSKMLPWSEEEFSRTYLGTSARHALRVVKF